MFNPSAAPRWKITTRRLALPPGSMEPQAARVRKLGMAAVPTTASALLRRNTRRVMDMTTPVLSSRFSVLPTQRREARPTGSPRMPDRSRLPPLKLRGPQNQPGDHAHIGGRRRLVRFARSRLRVLQLLRDRVVGLPGNISGQQGTLQDGQRPL